MSYGDTLDLVVRALGWALLHSIWQGAVIGFVVALLLSMKGRSPQQRYAVACVGLAAMVVAWLGTAIVMNQTLEPAPSRSVMVSPPVELGPAGPADRTPAIRVIESPEGLNRVRERAPMRARIEAWSSALVPLWLGGVVSCPSAWVLHGWGSRGCAGRGRCPFQRPCCSGLRRCRPACRSAAPFEWCSLRRSRYRWWWDGCARS